MAGRFAPSPTGPLHLGSLLVATASYLEACQRGVPWRLRIDDLDAPRAVPGAAADIMASLEAHGLLWDGEVDYQSDHIDAYEHALERLAELGHLFYCTCSRRQLRSGQPYPGTCRGHRAARADAAIRVVVEPEPIHFVDAVQGQQQFYPANESGDFIVRRRDLIIAYQLAAAADDGAPEIDHVVRGADLLDNTPRQLYLMRLLGLAPPEYAHVRLVTFADGSKLSKQTGAAGVDSQTAGANLTAVLKMLNCAPPPDAIGWSCAEILRWAGEHWNITSVPSHAAVIERN